MFDNSNPYTLRRKVIGGLTHYYIRFKDGQAVSQEVEISRAVYLEFTRFIKQERNLRRSDERHLEQSELTDEALYNRVLHKQKSLEDWTLDRLRDEQLQQVIAELSETQRRRFILYHECDLTYEQIAKIDGCTFQAVAKSVQAVKNNLRKIFGD